jgi:hypothetical protein
MFDMLGENRGSDVVGCRLMVVFLAVRGLNEQVDENMQTWMSNFDIAAACVGRPVIYSGALTYVVAFVGSDVSDSCDYALS